MEKSAALDFRLAALMAAINEGWEDLEAMEEDGALVVRVRKADEHMNR
jgi:hypothetical protein